jgi:hypothetical protein
MNCDEAFDALTATDSRSSDELQQHLLNCPRCREMREVLSPALALFQPSSDFSSLLAGEIDGDADVEPLRQKFLSLEAVQIARETAQRLQVSEQVAGSVPSRRDYRWLAVQVAVAAATSAAVALIFAFGFTSPNTKSRGVSGSSATVQLCLWKNKSDLDRREGLPESIVSSCVACHLHKSAMR